MDQFQHKRVLAVQGGIFLLHSAISKNAPEDVVQSLIHPENINLTNPFGDTPLQVALQEKRWELLPILIKNGADIENCGFRGDSPLYIALKHEAPADTVISLISPYNITRKSVDGKAQTAVDLMINTFRWDLLPVFIQNGADLSGAAHYDGSLLHIAVVSSAPKDVIALLTCEQTINKADWDGNTPLHLAVLLEEQQEICTFLVENGADVNLCNNECETALFNAVKYGRPAHVIRQLISTPNKDLRAKCGNTALHIAVECSRWEQMSVLLEQGVDINLKSDNRKSRTALHIAVSKDTPVHVIEQLVSPQNINMQSEQDSFNVGYTPLHIAVECEHWEQASFLIRNGADVNFCHIWGQCALHNAVMKDGPLDSIKQMISVQNINLLTCEQTINKADWDGNTPLHLAVLLEEQQEICTFLVENGADVNLCNNERETALFNAVKYGRPAHVVRQLISTQNKDLRAKCGNTALHIAVECSHWEQMSVLLEQGVDINLKSDNRKSRTALHIAVSKDTPVHVIEQLVSPQNINMRSEQDSFNIGYTPLHIAVEFRHWEQASFLIRNGADVNLCHIWGQSALHDAVIKDGPLDIVKQLISLQNINLQDDLGNTALHYVLWKARRNYEAWEMVRVLTENGCDINLCDNGGRTPLLEAMRNNVPVDVAAHLVSSHNTCIKDSDSGGKTAFQMAVDRGCPELVRLFIQYVDESTLSACWPDQPKPSSLQYACIATIRKHMPVKCDEAYKGLHLPSPLTSAVKLTKMADEILRVKQGS